MRDLDERMKLLDQIAAPDLWEDARTRPVRGLESDRGGQWGVAVAAVFVAALGLGLAVWAFLVSPSPGRHRPAHPGVTGNGAGPSAGPASTTNGEIWARVGGGDGPSFVYSIEPDYTGSTLLFGDGRDPDAPPETVNREAIGEDYAWSPDGVHVAFLAYSGYDDTQGEHTAIFLMDPRGTERVQLTSDGELDSGPSWSPDGSQITYASDRSGPYPYEVGCWATSLCPSDIHVMNADGTGDVQLTDDPGDDSQPSWSPDGTRIAFHSTREDPDGDIYVMNADGSSVTRLTSDNPGFEANPQWSPDGSKIAFVGFAPGGPVDIYVMDADGSNVTKLTDNQGNSFVEDLAWSPDGTQVAFTTDTGGAPVALYVMAADGSNVRKLIDDAGSIAWRPGLG
jgi:Tol biopolymer transport system component